MTLRCLAVVFLLLSAEASRPAYDLKGGASVAETGGRSEESGDADNAVVEAAWAKVRAESELGCHNWCFKCPEKDGNAISWKVTRARSGSKIFAMGALVIGSVATLGMAGVVTFNIAGVMAAVGVSTGAVMVGGAVGGSILVKDLLTGTRLCPSVTFGERNEGNTGTFKKEHEEMEYRVDEVQFLEIMGQMEDADGLSWFGKNYARNEINKTDRLNSVMACTFLSMNTKKWAELAIQSHHLTERVRKFGDAKKAIVAECGRWLCADEVAEVEDMGNVFSSFKKCGGRTAWHPLSWMPKMPTIGPI